MIADRDYMREPAGRWTLSVTVLLVVANVLVFLGQWAIGKYFPSFNFDGYFALSQKGMGLGRVWQLLTFQFLHGGPLHLLLNCWALFLFGRDLEEHLGRARFLTLYLFSGMVGGLVQLGCAFLSESHFGGMLVGASAGVFGLVAAYAALFPEREFTVLVFFILPVTLKAKMLLLWGAVFAIIGALVPSGNVAHAAHLGGMLGGLLYLNSASSVSTAAGGVGALWDRLMIRYRRSGRKQPPASERWQQLEWDPPRPPSPKNGRPDQFIAEEVDPILEKIAAHGIQSLTQREREILEQARTRMAKR